MSASTARSYGRGAAILSLGIGATGLITFGYFSLASYTLTDDEYGRISLLWSAIFITVSVLYRPVEQLLSRTIADHDARGVAGSEHLRVGDEALVDILRRTDVQSGEELSGDQGGAGRQFR